MIARHYVTNTGLPPHTAKTKQSMGKRAPVKETLVSNCAQNHEPPGLEDTESGKVAIRLLYISYSWERFPTTFRYFETVECPAREVKGAGSIPTNAILKCGERGFRKGPSLSQIGS